MQIQSQEIWAKGGEKYYTKIVEEFGNEVLSEDFELNRKKLAGMVFADKTKKELLDKITAEFVVPQIIQEAKSNENGISIIDVPLLFECGLNKICDIVIGVLSKKEICIKRIIDRDGLTYKEAEERIESQKNENFFKINCDYCIFNDGDNNIDIQIKDILNNNN